VPVSGVVVRASRDHRFDSQVMEVALPSSNSRQVVHTHVPLSPSRIILYRPRGDRSVAGKWECNSRF